MWGSIHAGHETIGEGEEGSLFSFLNCHVGGLTRYLSFTSGLSQIWLQVKEEGRKLWQHATT